MKKRIALFSAFVLLVSLFSFAMMPVGATDDGKADAFFFDFTSKEAYETGANIMVTSKHNRVGINGNISLEYDTAVRGLKMTLPAGATSIGGIQMLPSPMEQETPVSKNDFPLIAVKVKLAQTINNPSYALLAAGGIASTWRGGLSVKQGHDTTSTDWQLIIFDSTNYNPTDVWTSRTWDGVVYTPTHTAFAASETDTTVGWVQWAGAFTTVAAAEDYFKATTRTDGDIPAESLKADDFFFDFSNEESYLAESGAVAVSKTNPLYSVSADGNISLDYDKTVGGVKLTLPAGATSVGSLRLLPSLADQENPVSATTYPLIAVKVKLAQTITNPGYALLSTGGVASSWKGGLSVKSGYTDSEEWQLIIFDSSNYHPTDLWTSRTWDGVAYAPTHTAFTASETDTTVGWVQWAGAFQTEDDAWEYFELSNQTKPETGLIANGAGIRADLDYSVDTEKGREGLRFNQKLITVVDAEGNHTIEDAEGNTLLVRDIWVLMGTTKNVNNLDAFDQNSANGTTILAAQVKTCRTYTFDEATNTATYEFSALLNSVPQAQRGTDISARAYLVCKNANNEEVIVLGDVQTTNVAEMYTALGGANKFSAAVQAWMTEEI